jgi:hypothetical protein
MSSRTSKARAGTTYRVIIGLLKVSCSHTPEEIRPASSDGGLPTFGERTIRFSVAAFNRVA